MLIRLVKSSGSSSVYEPAKAYGNANYDTSMCKPSDVETMIYSARKKASKRSNKERNLSPYNEVGRCVCLRGIKSERKADRLIFKVVFS